MKPAVSLVAVAGRRRATLELASRLEREGFTGIYCPSPGDGLALCEALALVTREIPFGTSIAHIYTRHPFEYAQTAAVIHELSGGRFRFGIGVSHGPAHERLGIRPGKPLDDIRKFVAEVKGYAPQVGAMPPITLATLRRFMVALAGEIADGAVWPTGRVRTWPSRCARCRRRPGRRPSSSSGTWCRPASTRIARRRRL
jgi:alkanesulfonate monooxygenase SsuD/methylene tetrahydromethanopterin reductase-like flavin-dependent oxidoreductase (luciferase family)